MISKKIRTQDRKNLWTDVLKNVCIQNTATYAKVVVQFVQLPECYLFNNMPISSV